MITYSVEGVKMPKIKKRETSAWIRKVAASHGRKVGEVGYMFVDDEKILEVNNEYLGHDYYTDVITFDYDEGDVINGDIVISLDTVRTNAEQFGKTYDDELHRVIIHGILHLCGINDKGPGEREIMEEREQGSRHARRCFDIEVKTSFVWNWQESNLAAFSVLLCTLQPILTLNNRPIIYPFSTNLPFIIFHLNRKAVFA